MTYLSNGCQHCDALQGNFFVFQEELMEVLPVSGLDGLEHLTDADKSRHRHHHAGTVRDSSRGDHDVPAYAGGDQSGLADLGPSASELCSPVVLAQAGADAIVAPSVTASLITGGVTLAREHLVLLGEARGAYRLSNADVAGVIKTWTHTRTDLVELYTEQGRRWQGLDLGATRRKDVERYVALVAEELALVEQILALADGLKAWTIEAMLAKSEEQLSLEALLGGPLPPRSRP